MKTRFTVIVLFLLFFAIETSAQSRTTDAGRIGVGPQLGYFKGADAESGSVMPGGFFRARFSELVGMDLSINYRTEDYASGRVDVTQWPLLVSAMFYPVSSVYGLVGFGLYFTSFTFHSQSLVDLPDETSTRFGFHLGGGLEFELSRQISIFGDAKYVLLGYDLEDFDEVNASDFSANFFAITIGLMFIL
jgi:opacity protein-like surface antigen